MHATWSFVSIEKYNAKNTVIIQSMVTVFFI